MYLFFNTSANGEPKDWKAPMNDPFNWPRMIHLSWIVYDVHREPIKSSNNIIKPKGFKITEATEKKHKISQQMAEEKGVNIKEVLTPFAEAVKKAQYIVSFNLAYNDGVIGTELYRAGIKHSLADSNSYCLMQEATWFCKLKSDGAGYRWPTLQDIYKKIYSAEYDNPGEAQADVAVSALSFFHLLDIQAIELFE